MRNLRDLFVIAAVGFGSAWLLLLLISRTDREAFIAAFAASVASSFALVGSRVLNRREATAADPGAGSRKVGPLDGPQEPRALHSPRSVDDVITP